MKRKRVHKGVCSNAYIHHSTLLLDEDTLFIIIIIIGNKEKELFELKEKGHKIHRKKVRSYNKVKGYLDSKSLPNITQGHSFISCKLQLYLHGMKLLARILKFQQTFICSEIKLKR